MKQLLRIDLSKGLHSRIAKGMFTTIVFITSTGVLDRIFSIIFLTLLIYYHKTKDPNYGFENVLPIRKNTLFAYYVLAGILSITLVYAVTIAILMSLNTPVNDVFSLLLKSIYVIPIVMLSETAEPAPYRSQPIGVELSLLALVITGIIIYLKVGSIGLQIEKFYRIALWILPLFGIGIAINYRSFRKYGYGFKKTIKQH